jgi:predicted PurR-regulated permease PerM
MDYNRGFISTVKYFLLAVFLVLIVKYSGGILLGLKSIGNAAVPLISGLAIAYVLNILMKKLEKIYFPNSKSKIVNKSRRIICIFLSILIIIGVIVLVALIVIPEFVNAISVLVAAIPSALESVKGSISNNSDKYEVIGKSLETMQVDLDGILGRAMTAASGILTGAMNSILSLVGSLTSGLMNFVIALVFAIYVLVDKEKLSMQIKRIMRAFLKCESIKKLDYFLNVVNDAFSKFIVGQCAEAVIIGVLCTVGMLLFRFPYAVTVGVFISVTALIPVVGAYLGAALGTVMILTVSPMKALLFLIYITILQQLENNLIYPKVVGSSLGLPGIWVFAAIILGGGLGGILGMLLSVPIAATIYKLITDNIQNRLRNQEEKSRKRNFTGKDTI